MVGFPALVIIGHVEGQAFWSGMGQGLFVVALTVLVVVTMWHRGMRKFEAIGI